MAIHGTNAVFNLDNSGGTPTDLTGKVREIDPQFDQAIHDITVLGQTSRTKTMGLKDAKFTTTFISDNTIMDHLTALYVAQTPGGSTTWSWFIGPRGSTSGFEKFSGEALLTGIPVPVKVDDIETLQVTFEVTGTVTFGVF